MPAPRGRDLDLTRERLTEWFAARFPQADSLRIAELSGPGTTGFSNDTLMFDLELRENGEQRREPLVVRIQPIGFQVFPEYDLGLQYRIQKQLADTGVPVARMIGEEKDASLLGAPFYVMERVEGRIPTDNPPYHAGGWMTEIDPEERASIWWSGLESLTRIHGLDWKALGLGYLGEPKANVSPLEEHLAYYDRYLAWCWEDKPHPTCTPALEWLHRNRPTDPEPVVLCWGDARIGNMVFHQGRCNAVLDWEMARLASPEEDLAWWIYLDRHHSEGIGVPRLPGFPSREETIERYQEATGHQARNLDYYERFAALRFGVIMIRVAQQMKSYGVLPADVDFEVTNPCSRLLAQLLDLPDPAGNP
jgi:aminoglycoside phosphotransferase (APT) family kinase protein